MNRVLLVAALVASSSLAAVRSYASSVSLTGAGAIGAYSGTLSYDADAGLLSVSLTNTSPADNGGFITGFVFNLADDLPPLTLALDAASAAPFQFVTNESGSPYGTFDYGAALGGNLLGGGNPTGGIAVGQTRVFNFQVSGAPPSMSAASILAGGNGDPDGSDYPFLVRFRGFDDDRSDKVPGTLVPLPAAAWGGLAMLAGLAIARWRRHVGG